MRIVVDTNVLVSGLLWHGAPHAWLEHARNGASCCSRAPSSSPNWTTCWAARSSQQFSRRPRTTPQHALAQLRRLADLIEPEPLPGPPSRDPDDDHVIACARAARVDAIVSGDRDLLDLGEYQGIPILSATSALARIA